MIAIVTTYSLLLAFHIFAAVVWVGGALIRASLPPPRLGHDRVEP